MSPSFAQTYARHSGKYTDKWLSYLEAYSEELDPIRKEISTVLEIGVQNGGSLEVWASYLPKATKIIGCDIDPKCGDLVFTDSRIAVVVGDANSSKTKKAITSLCAEFDLIVDDGSHLSSDVIATFWNYFPVVRPGGRMIIEDVHTSYWKEWGGGLSFAQSSMQFLKALADVVNFEHWGIPAHRRDLFRGFDSTERLAAEETLSKVQSVTFMNSLCIITKASEQQVVSVGTRVGAGLEALVNPETPSMQGRNPLVFDQTSSPVSSIDDASPALLLQSVEQLREDVAGLSLEIQLLLNSSSWRLTRPLRATKSFFLKRKRRSRESGPLNL